MKINAVYYRSISVCENGWVVRILDQRQLPYRADYVELAAIDTAARASSKIWTCSAP